MIVMDGVNNDSNQQEKKMIVVELNEQIKRMTDYVEQYSQSNTAAVHNSLKATMRYRDSLVASFTDS
ncbi:MAG: hypothetical protein QNK26_01530 [Moritella sp.]|uniref:hypothetical protein n=1 Tax=Moritella sp. TaxID=78556 RepID=UPI0029A348F2|nr:hypothetical protein [Moritella sp.]MDX2319256.1 hypothetical protein [Moritella sp.]